MWYIGDLLPLLEILPDTDSHFQSVKLGLPLCIISNDKNPEASTEKCVGIHIAALHITPHWILSVLFCKLMKNLSHWFCNKKYGLWPCCNWKSLIPWMVAIFYGYCDNRYGLVERGHFQ